MSDKTIVIFRKFRDDGEVIALFPGIPGSVGCYDIESYMHVGQHGAADPDLVRDTDLATPEEYNDLKLELESIGYNLLVRQKMMQSYFHWNRKER